MEWIALAYVAALWGISWIAERQRSFRASLDTFYVAQRRAHWLWVSYGMVGTALSAITFLSVPGSVRSDGWTYLQVVAGYFLGYAVIAYGLLPLYYKYARASVYEYFCYQLGAAGEKTATAFFIISRAIGSSLRLFLALWVLQPFLGNPPFPLLAACALLIMLLYTMRGGIGALIYTDFFQTTVFLAAALYTCLYLLRYPLPDTDIPKIIELSPTAAHFWLKDLLAGAFIALSMTGLDQDQMQKNLSLPSLSLAQKNLLLYGALLFPVNLLFLWLGHLLWRYADYAGFSAAPDEIFALVVQHQSKPIQVLFVLGVSAAALSSADGSLTALTTAVLRNLLPRRYETPRMKNLVFLIWTLVFWLLLIGYTALPREKHILGAFLRFSGYTYGPLLGLFIFSRLTPRGDYPFVKWALPALLGISLGIEGTLGWFSGYVSIFWTAGVTALGLLGLNQVLRR
ncbi:MAG: hypothetical protein NZZ60_07640 [Bacteroidia bacterium]|nr:hypothetical protein [Bacteroidia bacterium]MDW8416984.1 hypothetical protein [Bacteroidia bacterium]